MSAALMREQLRSLTTSYQAGLADNDDVSDLAALLAEVQDVQTAAQELVAVVEGRLADVLRTTRGIVEVPGVGTVERKSGALRTRWDHARLTPLVARKAAETWDPDTHPSAPEYVAEFVARCAGIGYWRVGALKEVGVDPDLFCEKEYGRARVVLRRAESKAEGEAA